MYAAIMYIVTNQVRSFNSNGIFVKKGTTVHSITSPRISFR